MYGTLENRVKAIERKKQLFTHLEKEAEEIKKHGNIRTYERQGESTTPTEVAEERVRELSIKLTDQRTKINDTCRRAHYNKEGINQVLFPVRAAKKLLLDIEERHIEYKPWLISEKGTRDAGSYKYQQRQRG